MARKPLAKRRRKKARRQRNKTREAEWWAEWNASARPFRRRYLVGLRFGRHTTLLIDFDYETPIPVAALDPERPDESLEEIYDRVKAAELEKSPKVKA